MREWVRLIAPVAVIASAASPVYAAAYLTIEEAQKLAFPEAERFDEAHIVFRPPDVEAIQKISGQKVRTRGQQVWKAQLGSQTIGFFIIDYVIGKHLVIDYAVALGANGRIRRVELIEYRESYGGEIHSPDWLAQFVGKSSADGLRVDRDIRNISGATLSSHHVTDGIKRVLAFYETCLKK